MNERWSPTPSFRMLLVLGFMALAAITMDLARFAVTGERTWMFLIWNLFLAWIPLGAAAAFRHFTPPKKAPLPRLALQTGLAGVWFFFFPNAPYMITDFIHLNGTRFFAYQEGRWVFIREFRLWYDLVMITLFVIAALMTGFWSLFLLQKSVRESLGRPLSWVFSLFVLLIASFGIYLGRFIRWNSWDLLLSPVELFNSAFSNFNTESLAFTFLFFAFLTILYVSFYYWSFLSRRQDFRPVNSASS